MNNLLDDYEARRPRTYSTEWYHRQMCAVWQRAHEERKNCIIELHPRSGKSEVTNVYGPAWWLSTHPEYHFGLVNSEGALSHKFVSGTRDLLAKDGVQFEVERGNEFKIAGTRSLDLTYTGRGIHSNLSGRGFDTLTLDDTIKSGSDAQSEIVRERLWTDVVSAAVNRLSPEGIVVALQARLHSQDTIGKLLDTGMKFLRLHLPATNDDGTSAWFEDGYTGEKTVFPAYKYLTKRYPRAKLEEIFRTTGNYYFQAQYQQTPSLGDLSFFNCDNLPRYEQPRIIRIWTAWDAAQTATKGGSFSAGVALGMNSDNRMCLLDVTRGRWRQDELERRVVEHGQMLSRRFGLFPEAVIVERAAAGYGLIDRLSGMLPIVPLIPKGSKEDRAAAVCSVHNRGLVLFPKEASWLADTLSELGSFPLGKFRDVTDAYVHGLSYYTRPSEFAPRVEEGVAIYDTVQEYKSCLSDGFDDELPAFGLLGTGGSFGGGLISPATQRALNRAAGRRDWED